MKKGQYAFAKGDVSVGLDSEPADALANVWPNPVVDQLTVRSNTEIHGLNVWNATGQLTASVRPPAGTTQWQFDASAWSAGAYVIGVNNQPGQAVVVK